MTDIEQYDEYTLVWGGLLESIVLVSDGEVFGCEYGSEDYPQSVGGWLTTIEQDASDAGEVAEVYVTPHYHAPLTTEDYDDGAECVCAQYLTDHRPAYTFGGDDNG